VKEANNMSYDMATTSSSLKFVPRSILDSQQTAVDVIDNTQNAASADIKSPAEGHRRATHASRKYASSVTVPRQNRLIIKP